MEPEQRRLSAMHPALTCVHTAGAWAPLNGWQIADANTVFHETVLDLSGYAMDSLTFFPTSVGIQDPGIYTFKVQTILPSDPQQAIQVLDIVTSVPMDQAAVGALQLAGNVGPGLLGSTHEFETILFGMYRFFTENSNIPYPNYQQLERSQRFDSGEGTAADKLFCYRIVTTAQQSLIDGDVLQIPAARQLIAGVMAAEDDLVYMQRLKRSYELANQV